MPSFRARTWRGVPVALMIGRSCSRALILGVLAAGACLFRNSAGHAADEKQRSLKAAAVLQTCYAIKNKSKRLACYDKAARQFAPPTYKGRLGMVTEPFTISKPHRLRYRSYGVIFVLYLRDKHGEVLQNLHIGGGGEDEYLIRKPGTYSLKIDGSTSWEIWLEPIEESKQKTP